MRRALREHRTVRGRKVVRKPLLFPGYCFVFIELQWHAARWSPGTLGLIMAGDGPAHVPEGVIDEIRSRERDGLIELPRPPRSSPATASASSPGRFAGFSRCIRVRPPRSASACCCSF